MKKALMIGGAAVGAVLLARRVHAMSCCGQFTVEKMLERMPDTSPRKWMFLNISAIRENTDRILEKLETEASAEDRTRTVA